MMTVETFLCSKRVRCGVSCAAMFALVSPVSAVLFPQRFTDHTLCCGVSGPVGLEGGPVRGSVEQPATKPVVAPVAAVMAVAAVPVAVPPAKALEPAMAAPEQIDGYLKLDFDRLASFKFVPPAFDPAAKPGSAPVVSPGGQIPESIRQFDGRKAIVTGFMLAIRTDEKDSSLVKELLLVRDPMMCCYGVVPQMNEWVVVRLAKPVRLMPDVPVSFYGKLSVKEMYEDGYMTGIYLLDGDKMVPVKG